MWRSPRLGEGCKGIRCVCGGGGGFIYTSSSVRGGKAALEGSERSLGLGGTRHLCACAFACRSCGAPASVSLPGLLKPQTAPVRSGLGEKTSGVGGPWALGYRVGGVIRRH